MKKGKITFIYGLNSFKRERFVELLTLISNSTLIDEQYIHEKYKNLSKNKIPKILFKEIEKCSNSKVIINLDSLTRGTRMEFLKTLEKMKDIYKECLVVAVKYKDCYASRDEYLTWETPHTYEGWDTVKVVYPNKEDRGFLGTPKQQVEKYMEYEQSSNHHKYTLGIHMKKAREYIDTDEGSIEAVYASEIHDIGKPFARHKDMGKIRYNQHENVGAYDSLFCSLGDCNIAEVSTIINLHMEPYKWKRGNTFEECCSKYRKIWGDRLYNNVMSLHEADIKAHK